MGEVDFVSIGTNDLTQYTMAADRLLGDLAHLNNPWQPAVLKMIKLTVKGAKRASVNAGEKKYVSVCGEAAADPALAVVLVGLGVDTLSMNAGCYPRSCGGAQVGDPGAGTPYCQQSLWNRFPLPRPKAAAPH